MLREMRRKNQQLTNQECEDILYKRTAGVLSVYGDNEYPYGVPLSYVYDGKKIIFHCATQGHKLDAIQNHNKVSFCVIDQDQVVSDEYTTYFRSVIIFGKAYVIEDESKRRDALQLLGERYSPMEEGLSKEIERQLPRTVLVEILIDKISGKQAIELMKSNKNSEKI